MESESFDASVIQLPPSSPQFGTDAFSESKESLSAEEERALHAPIPRRQRKSKKGEEEEEEEEEERGWGKREESPPPSPPRQQQQKERVQSEAALPFFNSIGGGIIISLGVTIVKILEALAVYLDPEHMGVYMEGANRAVEEAMTTGNLRKLVDEVWALYGVPLISKIQNPAVALVFGIMTIVAGYSFQKATLGILPTRKEADEEDVSDEGEDLTSLD